MKEGPPVVAQIASKPACNPAGDFASNPAFGSDRSMDSAPEPNASELLSVVYDELRRLAAQKMAHERPGQTLQPTAVVHDAWLLLGASSGRPWDSREHFFAAAAEAMRRILIDRARRRARIRHGGEWTRGDAEDTQGERALDTGSPGVTCGGGGLDGDGEATDAAPAGGRASTQSGNAGLSARQTGVLRKNGGNGSPA